MPSCVSTTTRRSGRACRSRASPTSAGTSRPRPPRRRCKGPSSSPSARRSGREFAVPVSSSRPAESHYPNKAVKLSAFRIPQLSTNTWLRIAASLALVFVFLLNEADWYQFRFVQQLELWAYDTRLRLFMPGTLDSRIVILDIDEKSLNAEGRWPWSRNKLALMVRQLFDKYQIKVMGFDVAFAEPDPSSGLARLDEMAKNELKDDADFQKTLNALRPDLDYDKIFAEEIGKHPVALGFFLGGKTDKAGVLPQPLYTHAAAFGTYNVGYNLATGYSGNIKVLQDQAAAAGHLYPQLDFDGVTRRVPILMRYED